MSALKRDLETVAAARILFAHQSVGRNILAGLEAISADAGVPLLIEEIESVPSQPGPGLFHANVGRNGDYESKCAAFEQLLSQPDTPSYDVALLKFCYTDLGRGIGVEAAEMLNRYADVIETIQRDKPETRIVHATMPLRSHPTGLKAAVKRLIGREIPADQDNQLRNAFNALLRDKYADTPLFDIAAIESTRADGSRSFVDMDGRPSYTLAPEFTDDGGHLTPPAQRIAAAELVGVLAAALRRD
jgi:lysophospholipase L1-like esterase